MALTYARAAEVDDSVKAVCDALKAVYKQSREVLATNNHLSIDWGATTKPSYINEDVDGNLDGKRHTRVDTSNSLGSIAEFVRLMDGEVAGQGNHLGNINKLADAESD